MPREGPRAGRPPLLHAPRQGRTRCLGDDHDHAKHAFRGSPEESPLRLAPPTVPCRAPDGCPGRQLGPAGPSPDSEGGGAGRGRPGERAPLRHSPAAGTGAADPPATGGGRTEAEGGAADPKGGELRHPQRQHRPNAPSRIAREGFLRRGGVAPETPRRAIPDGLPPTGGKGTTRNSGGLRYGSQRDARASAARSVCAEPAGGPAVPPSRQLGHRPPPARTEGRLSPPTRRRGKRRRGSGALSLRDPGHPEGTPPTQRHPPLSLTRPQRRGTMLAACGHALGAGHRGTVARRPHHRQSLTASTPHPSHPRGETTTKRRAGARVRPARRAQSDHTGKHSARGREATPPARPRAPDGRPGALQGHHRRPGGSATRAQRRAAPPTPPPRGRGGPLREDHHARAVCCVRGTPASDEV